MRSLLEKLLNMDEENWIQDVDTKKKAPEGLFKDGSSQDIADWCIKTHKDLKTAISSLNYFCNRNKNIDTKICKKVEQAKNIIKKYFK